MTSLCATVILASVSLDFLVDAHSFVSVGKRQSIRWSKEDPAESVDGVPRSSKVTRGNCSVTMVSLAFVLTGKLMDWRMKALIETSSPGGVGDGQGIIRTPTVASDPTVRKLEVNSPEMS